ncbi:ATP-binding protein [Amycolatopsis rifamycinica]|uniref:AfsR family regulator n=1 Tax=Amycolatopsis rifamycinica TaxID=287986 RepID=A0A066TYT8_9PSEU|nr:ATP-binding protein [Amycolatopsis rifamycinica]KDN18732.1 AfsR family regulator [Amycolatopsis rifamycinica]
MGRPERPLDPTAGPIAAFAHELRVLRNRAGNASYRELARAAHFAPSVLSSAASGRRLPTLAVTLAFVSACGGDRGAWERRWRSVAQESRAQARRPAQLPLGTSTFVGRETELAEAVAVVRPSRAPVLVTGPIGTGKTAFAVRLAEEAAARFPDGQLHADLSDRGPDGRSTDGIVRGFLRALGVPAHLAPDDPAHRIDLYRSLLAEHRLFVLLTGATSEAQVRPLLGRTAHSQVVVTSRARLPALEDAHRVELDTFTRAESVALLARIAGGHRIRAEHAAAAAIAGLCGDLPLAVSIVGRRIAARPEWTIAATAGRLAGRDRLVDSLSVGDVNVRDRFTAAYEGLSAAGRAAVRHLGAEGGSRTTPAAVAAAMGVATETAEELLESIVDAGLLRRADVAGRYAIPTLVGVFAAELVRFPDRRE